MLPVLPAAGVFWGAAVGSVVLTVGAKGSFEEAVFCGAWRWDRRRGAGLRAVGGSGHGVLLRGGAAHARTATKSARTRERTILIFIAATSNFDFFVVVFCWFLRLLTLVYAAKIKPTLMTENFFAQVFRTQRGPEAQRPTAHQSARWAGRRLFAGSKGSISRICR